MLRYVRQLEGCSQFSCWLKLAVPTDSTAKIGMHNRVGSGRVRLLDVKWL